MFQPSLSQKIMTHSTASVRDVLHLQQRVLIKLVGRYRRLVIFVTAKRQKSPADAGHTDHNRLDKQPFPITRVERILKHRLFLVVTYHLCNIDGPIHNE
jgi:hypothetical protein